MGHIGTMVIQTCAELKKQVVVWALNFVHSLPTKTVWAKDPLLPRLLVANASIEVTNYVDGPVGLGFLP